MKKLIPLLFCLLCYTSHACTCIGTSNLRKAIKHTDIVAKGIVISKKLIADMLDDSLTAMVPNNPRFYVVEYTLIVKENYKGSKLNDTLKIVTDIGRNTCGFRFEIGKEYIVYADYIYYDNFFGDQKIIFTSLCKRTSLYDEGEEKKIKKYRRLLKRSA